MAHNQHKDAAPLTICVSIITVSDTRTENSDYSGQLIRELLLKNAHTVAAYRLVKDDQAAINAVLKEQLADRRVDAVLLNGGTGISSRDGTYEVVSGMLEKKISGFGELFRALSYQEIGTSAIMSRALAGAVMGRVVIAMPGSRPAVELAMNKIVVPEIAHMVYEVRR